MKKHLKKTLTILLMLVTFYFINIRFRDSFLEGIQVEMKDDFSNVDYKSLDVDSNVENHYYTSDEIDEQVNLKYCGRPKCEFLFAYYQPEQETKANMHFRV